jgi:CRISPR/Cas system-associated endonuclease Cas1
MRTLFLSGPGPQNIRLTKDGLQVGSEPAVPPPMFPYDTILVGNTKGFVSYPALKTLGKWGITVGLMGWGGTPLSVFVPFRRNDAPLRLLQLKAALDPAICAKVARALVECKTGTKLPPSLRTVGQIRAAEGVLAATYWQRLGIDRLSGYSKTTARKATTPVTASLNFAQGVLSVKVRTAIAKIGLDSTVGYLHTASRDKDGALAFDFQEPYRELVDSVAIEFAKSNPAAFIRDDDWCYRVKNQEARSLVLQVETALNRTVPYEGIRVTIDALILREIRKFSRWLSRPSAPLSFVRPTDHL